MTSGVKPRATGRGFLFVEKTVSGLILLWLLQELVCDAEEAEAGRDQHLRLPAIPRAGDSGDAPGKFPTNQKGFNPLCSQSPPCPGPIPISRVWDQALECSRCFPARRRSSSDASKPSSQSRAALQQISHPWFIFQALISFEIYPRP